MIKRRVLLIIPILILVAIHLWSDNELYYYGQSEYNYNKTLPMGLRPTVYDGFKIESEDGSFNIAKNSRFNCNKDTFTVVEISRYGFNQNSLIACVKDAKQNHYYIEYIVINTTDSITRHRINVYPSNKQINTTVYQWINLQSDKSYNDKLVIIRLLSPFIFILLIILIFLISIFYACTRLFLRLWKTIKELRKEKNGSIKFFIRRIFHFNVKRVFLIGSAMFILVATYLMYDAKLYYYGKNDLNFYIDPLPLGLQPLIWDPLQGFLIAGDDNSTYVIAPQSEYELDKKRFIVKEILYYGFNQSSLIAYVKDTQNRLYYIECTKKQPFNWSGNYRIDVFGANTKINKEDYRWININDQSDSDKLQMIRDIPMMIMFLFLLFFLAKWLFILFRDLSETRK